MKKYFLLPLIIVVVCGIAFAGVKHFWRGETMTVKQAQKKWGDSPFDAAIFKSKNSERSKMVVSLINSKVLIGKDRKEIRDLLGSHDGYYFTDMYPAYIVSEEAPPADTWQIVCLLDKDYKVKEVIIHKNCCDK